MASYLLQPDGSNTCCECPDREGPCDDCTMPECCCGFDALDGSMEGRKWLTKTWTVNGSYQYSDHATNHCSCTLTFNFTKTWTYDPVTCDLAVSCTGEYQFDTVNDFDPGSNQHESGDWCDEPSAGCGICASDCAAPVPSSAPPDCTFGAPPGCSCTPTLISCSYSNSQTDGCNCAAGQPVTVSGSCTLTQTVELSDECTLIECGERVASSVATPVAATKKSPAPNSWPMALLPLKLLAKEGDRGAGDIIARSIGPIGGDAFKAWYKKLFGKDCGCGHRQEILNARWPL